MHIFKINVSFLSTPIIYHSFASDKYYSAMKRLCILALAVLASCGKDLPSGPDPRAPYGDVSHGMIELGEKLEDPYAVENMEKALRSLFPTKAERTDIHPTDLYVRFLPRTDDDLTTLRTAGLYLLDHPMDYRIVKEGDWYQDPSLEEGSITWQYAVVDKDFEFPEGIGYETLGRCYISEHDPATRAGGIDWAAVERESFRLTGNGDLLAPLTKAEPLAPSGRITLSDPLFAGGKPVGVSGVTVACNVFTKICVTHTDRDGYYTMDKTFTSDPRYRLVFQNEKGFSVGLNLILVPASVSTLGVGGPGGIDYNVTEEDDGALMRRTAVNNAAYDYYSRCIPTDLDITPPPGDLRIWIIPFLENSSAPMLHHGAGLDYKYIKEYAEEYAPVIRMFLPDITIGTKVAGGFSDIYEYTVHELAHASHFTKVCSDGTSWWTAFITYIITSYIHDRLTPYGHGTGEGAGNCAVGEMWAYFLGSTIFKDRYGGGMPVYPPELWFRPEILGYLYERGSTRSEIFRVLRPEVNSVEALRKALVEMYPERGDLITDTFGKYGR